MGRLIKRKKYCDTRKIKKNLRIYEELLVSIPIILGILIWLLYLIIPQEKCFTIVGFKWERSMRIQQIQTFYESDWELPANAKLDYTEKEIWGYRRVNEKDVPIFKKRKYYWIDKWVYEKTVTTRGEDHYPYWGRENLNEEEERVSSLTSEYRIVVTNKIGKQREISVPYEVWRKLEIRQTVKIRIVPIIGTGEVIKNE